MNVTAYHLATVFRKISARLDDASDQLCQLDGQIGDGDHGTTMALGFEAVVQMLVDEDLAQASIGDLLSLSAEHFLDAVGATAGPLYAAGLQSAAIFARERPELTVRETPLLLAEISDGIAALGKAQPGDKTMMDVWFPVAQHIRSEPLESVSLQKLALALRGIATDGVASTKTMVASKGRTARLGERSLGHADPGATSAAIIIDCFCDFFEKVAN